MSKLADGLKKLVAEVEIEDVRLVEANVKTKVRSPADVGAIDVLINQTAEIGERQKGGTFFVVATIDTQIVPEENKEDPVVSVVTSFELRYHLPKGFRVDPHDLQTFAETNGIYNAWPYWREFVQSTFARMGLPSIVLPLFRIREVMEKAKTEKEKQHLSNSS